MTVIASLSFSFVLNSIAQNAVPVNADDAVVIYNSRALTVQLSEDKVKPLHELDLVLLASIEQSRIGSPLESVLANYFSSAEHAADRSGKHSSFTATTLSSDDYLAMISFCGRYASTGQRRFDIVSAVEENNFREKFKKFVFDVAPFDPDNSAAETTTTKTSTASAGDDLSVYVLVDPLSLAGQRAAALIKLIQQQLRIRQTVVLLPRPEISEFPLQNFYSYVLSPHDSSTAAATFRSLPKQHTLTVRIDAPEPWNIQASSAFQDIDNLRCSSTRCGDDPSDTHERTDITYTLKNILVAGQCFQMPTRDGNGPAQPTPPNGLQLTLSLAQRYNDNADNATRALRYRQSDTLVMQNLGYYQLQASPGLWVLNLARGKATQLFTIDGSVQSTVSTETWGEAEGLRVGGGTLIAVRSFADVVNRITVTKRPGMEKEKLLDDDGGDDDNEDGKELVP